jgi:UDP-N-acetylmuramate dehydrogenase
MPTDALQKKLGDRLQRDASLARYTAARLGGPAEWLYIARDTIDELVEVVLAAWAHDVPIQIIGGGANVLVSDEGVRGLTIINHVSEVKFGDWVVGCNVSATSGTSLPVLVQKCQLQGLSGLEWAASVPGTIGGAIVNNAGAHGSDIAACLADVVILETSGPKLYGSEELEYDYRHSILKSRQDRRFLVLLATFNLKPDKPEAIKERMAANLAFRRRTQPPGASLGSIFKNPPGDYAGRLIDAAGLKEYRIGGVMVSPVHANFFINDTKSTVAASALDYYALIQHVQETVFADSGVKLAMEIQLVGEWGQ